MNLLGSRSVEEVPEMPLSEDDDTEESSSEEEEDDWGHIPFSPRRDDDAPFPLRLSLWKAIAYGRDRNVLMSMQSMQGNVVNMWQTSFEIETIGWPVLPFDAFTDVYGF